MRGFLYWLLRFFYEKKRIEVLVQNEFEKSIGFADICKFYRITVGLFGTNKTIPPISMKFQVAINPIVVGIESNISFLTGKQLKRICG